MTSRVPIHDHIYLYDGHASWQCALSQGNFGQHWQIEGNFLLGLTYFILSAVLPGIFQIIIEIYPYSISKFWCSDTAISYGGLFWSSWCTDTVLQINSKWKKKVFQAFHVRILHLEGLRDHMKVVWGLGACVHFSSYPGSAWFRCTAWTAWTHAPRPQTTFIWSLRPSRYRIWKWNCWNT